jgi:hypothetical protein
MLIGPNTIIAIPNITWFDWLIHSGIFEMFEIDVAITRYKNCAFAFNNSCPHMKLHFFDSIQNTNSVGGDARRIDDQCRIHCRWYENSLIWVQAKYLNVAANHRETARPMAQNSSAKSPKNRNGMTTVPGREADGHISQGLELNKWCVGIRLLLALTRFPT